MLLVGMPMRVVFGAGGGLVTRRACLGLQLVVLVAWGTGKNFQSIKINRLQNIVDRDYVAIVTNKLLYSYKKSEQAFCMNFLGRYYEK